MQLNVKNETSTLKAVVLGQPGSIGKVPTLEETYDAKSYESVLHNIYPHEEDIFKEMRCFESVLLKYLMKYIPKEIVPTAHHWLILHGRYVCMARTPKCSECGLNGLCRYSLKPAL